METVLSTVCCGFCGFIHAVEFNEYTRGTIGLYNCPCCKSLYKLVSKTPHDPQDILTTCVIREGSLLKGK